MPRRNDEMKAMHGSQPAGRRVETTPRPVGVGSLACVRLFSFFPAIPASGDTGFPRPLIDLPAAYFNPASWRGPKGLGRNRTPDELRCLWNRLVEQVRGAGLVLGTRADLPRRRR